MEIAQQEQKRKVEVTIVFDQNARATEPVVVNVGGARSSKSYSIAQLMVKKFNEEQNKNFLTTRKTLPALRMTAYKVAVDMMKDYGCYEYFKHNKTERTIYNPYNNNLWLFTSVDDREKIKSTEFNYIHMEEANEFNYDDYMILKLRMSGKEGPEERNQMYLSLNPTEIHGWVNAILMPQKGVKVIHSTYEDAIQFLPASYVNRLEALEGEDLSYWLVYGLGEFAQIKGIIHQMHIIPSLPAEPIETIYGLDFGFVNPNMLLQIDIDMEHMALYLTELLYQSGMTNAQLKEALKELILEEDRGREIYADSAEPARIEEIYHEGFNIHKSDKSVTDGIDAVNRFKLYSTENSPNANREIGGYKRKVDRNGVVLEDPVKFNDHSPNSLRYGVYTHLRDRLLSLDPAWTIYSGTKKEKPEEEKPVTAPESDDVESPSVVVSPTPPEEEDDAPATILGEAPKGKKREQVLESEAEKKRREDEDWAV